MGVWRSTTTPAPIVEREEDLSGVGNIDNSEMNTKKNSVNDYSVDLNFISLHLNTLASSGAILVIVLILLILARFLLTGGATRLMNRLLSISCLPICCCPGSGPPGHQEPSGATPQDQLPPPPYSQVPDLEPQEPGAPPGGATGESQQDSPGQDLSEIKKMQQSIVEEMKQLRTSIKYCKKLEETTIGSVRGLRTEVSDMRALCREEISERRRFLRENLREYSQGPGGPPPVAWMYPQVPRSNKTDDQRSTYLREFFRNLVAGEEGIPQEVFYRLDTDTLDTSDTSGDSGNQSIVLD